MKFAFVLLFIVYMLGASALPAIERASDDFSFGNLQTKLDNAATDPTRATALIEELEHAPSAMLVQLGSQQSVQLHNDGPSTRTWIIGATTGVIIGIVVLAFILYFCCFKYDYSRYLSVDLRAGAVKQGTAMPGSKLDRTPILESPADVLHVESEASADAPAANTTPTVSGTRSTSSSSSSKTKRAGGGGAGGASGTALQRGERADDATTRRISAPRQPHRKGSHLHEKPIHHAEKVASRLSPEEIAAMEARAAEAKNQIARQISKEIAAKEDSDLEEELLHEEARMRGHSAAGLAKGH